MVGLFFYASYPATSLRDIGLPVLSISGEKDGLSTPQAIADSVANLPADATFVEVPGATHAYFGDYGLQAGDGTATVDKKTATQAIATATLNWLNQRS